MVAAFGIAFVTFLGNTASTILFAVILITAFYCAYKIINSKLDYKIQIFLMLLISVVLKVLWNINTNSVPNSDFAVMYNIAGNIIQGDFSGMQGLGYIARFPHLTFTVIYMAVVRLIFHIFLLQLQ